MKGDTSFIGVPNERVQYELCMKAVYGGRCQPLKKHFLSKDVPADLDALSKEERSEVFKNVDSYLVDGDVVSLYPTAMTSFESETFQFPRGDGRFADDEEIERIESLIALGNYAALPHGIYEVNVQPNASLINPVLPMKNQKGYTVWDVQPREFQAYALPDLVSGLKHGYRFEVLKVLIYDSQEAGSVFEKYINLVYLIKAEEDKNKDTMKNIQKNTDTHNFDKLPDGVYEVDVYITGQKTPIKKELSLSDIQNGSDKYVVHAVKTTDGLISYNPTRRLIAKLLMNSLYGKMLQKKIDTAQIFVESDKDMSKFLREHDWQDLI